MKIGQSLDSYALNNRLPRSDVPVLSLEQDSQAGTSFSTPTVSTSSAATPSALANALWLVRAEQPDDVYVDPAAQTAEATSDGLYEEFSTWSDMTPAEKIRATILEAHGLDEDSLKNAPEELRKLIEEEIRQAIKDQLLPSEATDTAASGDGATQAGLQQQS